MNINFKNYEYDGAWYGKEMIDFHGQTFNVDVQIDIYDEEVIPEDGRNVFLKFVNKLNDYTTKIADSIFKYYCEMRYELGYFEGVNTDYPAINSSEEILEMITLTGITVPY